MPYKEFILTCPKCHKVQHNPHCGNKDCRICDEHKPPEGELYQVWTKDGNGLKCPYCGFTKEASWWEDAYVEGFLKANNVSSFTELYEKSEKNEQKRGISEV